MKLMNFRKVVDIDAKLIVRVRLSVKFTVNLASDAALAFSGLKW